MGTTTSNQTKGASKILLENGCVIENYIIKLTSEQMAHLFFPDIRGAKRTLTWKTMIQEKQITFRKCIEQKIDVNKLYNMQPDLEEWISNGKVDLKDCKDMQLWRPNPFYHFKCHIGDLIEHKEFITSKVLINGGVKFDTLVNRYGLTPEIMTILKYSPEDWICLGIDKDYLSNFSENQWQIIFNKLTRAEVIAAISFLKRQQTEN